MLELWRRSAAAISGNDQHVISFLTLTSTMSTAVATSGPSDGVLSKRKR